MAMERRRRHIVFGVLAALAAVLLGWGIFHRPEAPAASPPAVPVVVQAAVIRDFATSTRAIGAARAWTSDTIYAQVSGRLIRVAFREGSEVHAGDVLAEVDPAPYRAVLLQQLGTLHRDEALLAEARLNLRRYQLLAQQDSIARQTYEDQKAAVAQAQGTVELDEGLVAAARVNLDWCKIRAPITGRAGVRLVDVGNLVSAGGSTASTAATAAATSNAPAASQTGTGILVINQIVPIAVTFTLPEDEFSHMRRISSGFRAPLAVEATSQENGAVLGEGQVAIADNAVDPATGTVELKARFENRERRLWPGQFVNVKLAGETLAHVTVIPLIAVNRGPQGSFVFVVGRDRTVAMRPVVVLASEGGEAAIGRGLQPGERVVTDGQMALRPGARVRLVQPGGAPGA
ncbi:MAG: efflux RND transporter periplasmic adaptor subunit [Sphingomonadales bacterium]|nr:efflux RND transporter periplasmic adaptor subunit [Sphingomonadales bacterium]